MYIVWVQVVFVNPVKALSEEELQGIHTYSNESIFIYIYVYYHVHVQYMYLFTY